MNLLKKFEHKLESLFEGIFAKGFKSGVHPVELAKKLEREMVEGKTVSIRKTYAPNQYTIHLSEADKEKLASFEPPLIKELQDFLLEAAKKEKLTMPSHPEILILSKGALNLGEFEIESELVGEVPPEEGEEKAAESIEVKEEIPMPIAQLELLSSSKDAKIFPLKKLTVIGRLKTNNIILEDPNVSRIHAEIRWEDNGFYLYDLESTNGTFANGKKIEKHKLENKDTITVGNANFVFSLRT